MPGFHVNDLKTNTGAFARGYLFNIYLEGTEVGMDGGDNKTAYLVRSSNLPAGTIEPIEVPWQGQTYKIGSTHTFDTWSCTFNVDMAADIRKNFLEWQKKIHDPETNEHGEPDSYLATVKIELLGTSGDPILTYTLEQAWPSEVGEVDLAYDNKTEVAQFDVTFNYNWYTTE